MQTANTSSDPNAVALLKKTSAKYKAYSSIETSFTIKVDLPDNPNDQNIQGKLTIKGSKFYLSTPEMNSYCDGKTIWNHLPNDNQIQISQYTKSEQGFDPQDIFTIWDKEFTTRIKESGTFNSKAATILELFPIKKNESYFKLEVYIEKSTNNLLGLKMFEKNGTKTTYSLTLLGVNRIKDDSVFTLNVKNFPKAEIIDLR